MAAERPAPGLVRPDGRAITDLDVRRAKAQANLPDGSASLGYPYEAGRNQGQWFGQWRGAIRSPDLDYLPFRNTIVGRVRDVVRNEPIAAAAIARRKNAVAGSGWRLSARPNARALGITPEAAKDLAAQIESEWRQYAGSHTFMVDAERKLTLGQLLRVMTHGLMADGEGLGLVEIAGDEPTRYATRLRIIDPDRLSNPVGRINDKFWRDGIEHDERGRPIRYWFRQAHPGDYVWTGEAYQWVGYDRFVGNPERPQVLDWFDAERAQQSRGVSRFVQTLKSFRALSKFTDATLQNATINALKVGFVYSNAGIDALSDVLSPDDYGSLTEQRRAYYENNPIGDGIDAHYAVMAPGDKVEMATAERQVTGFDQFTRAIIRLIATSLSVTYEEISMDFSQTNYSSARAALLLAVAENEALLGILKAQAVHPLYVCWLEEAFERGYVQVPEGAPDFLDAIEAYCESRWIGPKRGYIDPVKEILAAAARIELGVSTLEDECAEQGRDWEDVIHQQALEAQLRRSYGLEPEDQAVADAIQDTKNPAKKAPPATDASGDPVPDAPPPTPKPSALRRAAALTSASGYDAELDARPSIAA